MTGDSSQTEKRDGNETAAALIVAAGLSSRMGDWKPAMRLGEVPILVRVIQTFLEGGVSHVWVVTGHRGEEIPGLLHPYFRELANRIHLVHNARYAQTQMFDSVRLGFSAMRRGTGGEALTDWRRVFVTAADVPLFTAFTLRQCLEEASAHRAEIVIPTYLEAKGHPILLGRALTEEIMGYSGERGLKGVLEASMREPHMVPVPDPGVSMDADTPEEFEALRQELGCRQAPSDARCRELLAFFGCSRGVVSHGRAVAELAEEIAEAVGAPGDVRSLVRAGGWLHDIAKGKAHHAERGADLLRSLGYVGVAELVREHMDPAEEHLQVLDETAILFLADKLVREDRRVSLQERFAPAAEKFQRDPAALAGVMRRQKKAELVYEKAVRKGFLGG